MLIQFMKENMKKPSAKKINMFDYVAIGEQAEIRPVLKGVYMDKENKVAVATDTFAIIISKSKYKPTKSKNGIVTKDGKSISGKYVNYNYALNLGALTEIEALPEETIVDAALITMAEAKLKDIDIAPAVSITANRKIALFPVRKLPLLLEVGLSGWKYSKDKGAYYYEDDDKKIIVMGVYVD